MKFEINEVLGVLKTACVFGVLTHRQQVLHGDDEAGVSDEPVPQAQDVSDRLQQHAASKQHEVETGHQVAQAEDVDPRGAGDEDEAEHQPEEIAEHKHFGHVEVAPEKQTESDAEKERHKEKTTCCQNRFQEGNLMKYCEQYMRN